LLYTFFDETESDLFGEKSKLRFGKEVSVWAVCVEVYGLIGVFHGPIARAKDPLLEGAFSDWFRPS